MTKALNALAWVIIGILGYWIQVLKSENEQLHRDLIGKVASPPPVITPGVPATTEPAPAKNRTNSLDLPKHIEKLRNKELELASLEKRLKFLESRKKELITDPQEREKHIANLKSQLETLRAQKTEQSATRRALRTSEKYEQIKRRIKDIESGIVEAKTSIKAIEKSKDPSEKRNLEQARTNLDQLHQELRKSQEEQERLIKAFDSENGLENEEKSDITPKMRAINKELQFYAGTS